jgi:hypothetical protein
MGKDHVILIIHRVPASAEKIVNVKKCLFLLFFANTCLFLLFRCRRQARKIIQLVLDNLALEPPPYFFGSPLDGCSRYNG